MIRKDPDRKLKLLHDILERCDGAVLAFSGGVDSTFLLDEAFRMMGTKLLAVTVNSPFMDDRDVKEAVETAGLIGAEHIVIEVDEGEIEGFSENPPDRCYLCKRHLFSRIKGIASKRGIGCVIDATNAGDSSDYRPGLKALDKLGILSPLKEAGLTKEDIRPILKERGFANWDKPAAACIASRIPYGEPITRTRLRQVKEAEAFLDTCGFRGCRVRHHGEVARIEVAADRIERLVEPELRRRVVERFREIGFRYITVDLEGYRTGSLNESLDM